jgi:hypothetical protein
VRLFLALARGQRYLLHNPPGLALIRLAPVFALKFGEHRRGLILNGLPARRESIHLRAGNALDRISLAVRPRNPLKAETARQRSLRMRNRHRLHGRQLRMATPGQVTSCSADRSSS